MCHPLSTMELLSCLVLLGGQSCSSPACPSLRQWPGPLSSHLQGLQVALLLQPPRPAPDLLEQEAGRKPGGRPRGGPGHLLLCRGFSYPCWLWLCEEIPGQFGSAGQQFWMCHLP